MALSDYERRVLHQFEAEFSHTSRQRWRVRGGLHAACCSLRHNRLALLCTLLGLLACAVIIVFAPPTVAPCLAAVVGVLTGFALARQWHVSGGSVHD